MANTNIGATAVSDLTNAVASYEVSSEVTDAATGEKETTFQHMTWPEYFGYYMNIPELKKAIDALATWAVGKGFIAGPEETVILEHVTGWGEDTFNSIAWNLFVTKKILGDAFAEIIRDEASGNLTNLKVLDPSTIKIIANERGIIKRYEQTEKVGSKKTINKWKPEQILHLCNDRVADSIHGIGVVQACKQVILMRNEAMADWKTVLHRNVNPLKIIHLDTDDEGKIAEYQTKYEKAINLKEVIFVPKGNVEVEIPNISLQAPIDWIKYLENFFYQAVGVPKVITGGSEEFTESSAKISFLTFSQIYEREQNEFVADLWNQIGIRIKLNKPVSLQNELLSDTQKDSGQLGTQPHDLTAGEE